MIAYIDYKTKIIPLKYNITIACIGIFNLFYTNINILLFLIPTIIVFVLLLLCAYSTDGGIGGGDIQLLTALTLIVGKDIFFVIIYTSIIGSLYAIPLLIRKKKSLKSGLALAPFITLGTLTYLIF